MDKTEARQILRHQLAGYRERSYQQLLHLMKEEESFEIRAGSGATYRLEFQAFWDDSKNKNIRVLGSIDDGGLRAIIPICEDFIISPDGSFIGEQGSLP